MPIKWSSWLTNYVRTCANTLFEFEVYLRFGSKTDQQTYTESVRINAHDLRIDRGRYEGLKV